MPRILIFIIVFLMPFSLKLFSGAWVQKKNSYYLKLAASYLRTGKEFNHLGRQQNILEESGSSTNNTFRDFRIIGYFEYGLTNRLTITSDFLFKFLASEWISNETYFQDERFLLNTIGFADLTISTRYVVLNRATVISIQPGFILPLGYDTTPENDGPRLGNGEIAFQTYLLFGQSFYPLPVYLTGGIGYRFRGGELHDEILLNAEAGFTKDKFLIKLYFEGIKNTIAPPDIFGQTLELPLPGGVGVTPDILFGDQDFAKISPSIIYYLNKNISMQFELTKVAFGKNIISGTSYTFGIIFEK